MSDNPAIVAAKAEAKLKEVETLLAVQKTLNDVTEVLLKVGRECVTQQVPPNVTAQKIMEALGLLSGTCDPLFDLIYQKTAEAQALASVYGHHMKKLDGEGEEWKKA